MNTVIQKAAHSRFELEKEGLTAVADYILSPGVIIITHVVVPPQLRGQGLASDLAAAVITTARKEGLKVRPLCSFMVAYFERHPEHSDLLPSGLTVQ